MQTARAIPLSTRLFTLLAVLSSSVAAAETFTLNLKNTDIHSLIETVSKQSGKNFVVDPRVKAKVTVISSHSVDGPELYQIFLSVLQVHGYSAVPSGDIVKIVPDVNAKQGAVPMLTRRNDDTDQLVTHVIQVQNVPAAQLVPILRPLVPQQGHLAAYAATNALIITDRAANIDRMARIVRRIDVPDNDEIEVVRLEHASAAEVVRILGTLQQTIAAKGAVGAAPGAPKLAADERTNSVLISGDRAARLRLRGLIAHLDTPLGSGGNTRVIYLRYANAEDLVAILKGVQESQAKQDAPKGKAPDVRKNELDIQADEHTNSLIVTGPPDALRNLEAVIRQLDIRRAQVLVEAIIAEISENNSRQLGVSWIIDGSTDDKPAGAINLGGTVGTALGLRQLTAVPDGSILGLGVFSRDRNNPGTNFALLLRALAADANNNILSTPSLVTLDNQEAQIVVGQNVPFVTGQFTDTGSGSGAVNPFQTIERQDIGVTLKVKPQINEGSTIKLDIEQEVSTVASTSVSASDLITNKRSIQTTVLVDDGQTLVLGGLINDELRDRQEKVPLLGDIPIIGRLFQYRSTEKVKQNLMVFLHPKILRDIQAGNTYTGEKYNYLRAQQLVADERGIGLLTDEIPILPELEIFLQGGTHRTPQPAEGNRGNQ